MPAFWLNGTRVAPDAASVSVLDHGLLYGDGVFEGLRFYQGRCLLLTEHLQRLWQSAHGLQLAIPYTQQQLADAIDDTIAASDLREGYLRLVVTRGTGPLGVDPTNCPQPTVFIIADKLQMVAAEKRQSGLRVAIVASRRVPNSCWDSRIKSLNYLNNVLARLQARGAGADDAIMLNENGHVAEGTAANVFAVRDGVLLTPPVSDGALAGVTRALILRLADGLALPWRETSLTAHDLYAADECFFTGTGIELLPLRTVDGYGMGSCPGPLFTALLHAFNDFVQHHTADALKRQAI